MTSQAAEGTQLSERGTYQNIGLVMGPAVFALMMVTAGLQDTMADQAWRTAAVGLWMAIWWATEAIPVPATAFLPIVTFDLLGIASVKQAAQHYSNPIIYLFLGAFVLAIAVERWNLHRRIALAILSRTGTDGRRLIGGFMLVAASLSMWMTNTSTTMMLMPIALSVVGVVLAHVDGLTEKTKNNFQTAMLLGLAFAATIGGLATLVGTPTNALLAAFVQESYGIEISFLRWMMVGVPITMLMLPLAWLILTRWVYAVDIPASKAAQDHLLDLKHNMGSITLPEKRVALIFGLVILGWIMRRPIVSYLPIEGLSDTGIAMAGALALFLMPSGDKEQPQLMIWADLNRLPWGVLILFGGGLSLAAAIADSGLAQWLGQSLSPLSNYGVMMLVIAATALVIFLTELTSNVATTATFLPVIGAIAVQSGIPPMVLCVPITLAASCAFMLPVATPPNAIVYASGMLTIPQMARAGFYLNICGMFLLTLVAMFWAPVIFS
jgi:sodium-dependent dicarboxylate transporter 2/3/5